MSKYEKKPENEFKPRKIIHESAKVVRITLSDDAMCAHHKECYAPLHPVKAVRDRWIAEHDLFVTSDNRVFTLVDTQFEVFFMDAITGTLFQFGECLTSQMIKRKDFTRNRERAIELLKDVHPMEEMRNSNCDIFDL